MSKVLKWTFGGLNQKYYLRQLFFGLVMSAILLKVLNLSTEIPPIAIIIAGLNALLYPYSRFVWEGIVSFFLGDNIFFVPAPVLMVGKLITMLICLKMAVVIAPIGLLWLYWHHSRSFAVRP